MRYSNDKFMVIQTLTAFGLSKPLNNNYTCKCYSWIPFVHEYAYHYRTNTFFFENIQQRRLCFNLLAAQHITHIIKHEQQLRNETIGINDNSQHNWWTCIVLYNSNLTSRFKSITLHEHVSYWVLIHAIIKTYI